MAAMARPRKPYIQREKTRHGKIVWYFRRDKEARIRLPGVYGSKEFNDAYNAALAGAVVEKKTTAPRSTLRWLVDQYYQSGRFNRYAYNTQRNQRLALENVCKTGARLNFAAITEADIRAGMVRREATPTMEIEYLRSMKAVMRFALDNGWIEKNPAANIQIPRHKTDGYHTWTLEEVARFQERHPIGTQARLALDIMLYTGLRRGDAITLGRQHIKNGIIRFRTGKTGAELDIPILPPLEKSIEASKTGDLVFLINTRGKPWKNISFGYWFADRCDEAGVPGRAHGLRKAGATIAANNGATPFELTALYGWSSTKMAELYTRKADKARLAERAANKLYPHHKKGAGTK
ncbi:tyrosine-type recombinase/integrase [Aquamicrobium segne]|uniref:Tyrosine-type recombinase/integrase n=1 Tax=Aquamicrobium segne TaxID=469547 RepID=A0ABW0GXJ9_9HYPH